jgi:acetolactate synthase I/II/III large subunit
MLTCQYIAKFLKNRGVKQVFGTPGSDTINLINAFSEEGIRYILTHHENTAAYMASTYGEITGVPGVVIVTKGPGVTNITSGIAAAYLDRRPIIVFSAILDPELLARNPHQEVALVPFCGLISKLSEEITSENVVELIERAYSLSLESRPGAVYLPISPVQSVAEVNMSDDEAIEIINKKVSVKNIVVPDISVALELISKAKRPLTLVGVSVVGTNTSKEAVAFIEKLRSPACVTLQAVGQIPCDNKYYIGMYGWFGTPIDKMMKEADLIITVGLDGWDIIRPFKSEVPILSIDSVDANDRTFQPVTNGLVGDIGKILSSLCNGIKDDRDLGWGVDEAHSCYDRIHNYELTVSKEHSEVNGIAPQDVYKEIRKITPKDTIITADAGSHKSLASQAWESYGPKGYFVSNGLSPMGFSIGAAMGAKLAEPDKVVISFVGDGGFLMYAGELATWARLNIPMIQVVMVDHSLTQVKSKQEKQGFNTEATSFQAIDYCAIARSMGIHGVSVNNKAALRKAVLDAIDKNIPTTIEVILDGDEYLRMPSAV